MSAGGQPTRACPRCFAANHLEAATCAYCGHDFSQRVDPAQAQTQAPDMSGWQRYDAPPQPPASPYIDYPRYAPQTEPKSMLVGILLALFFGSFGAHRFYLGHGASAWGMLMLTILGIATSCVGIGVVLVLATGIWAIVDVIMMATGSLTDADGRPLRS